MYQVSNLSFLIILLPVGVLFRSIICWDLRTEKRVSTHLHRMGGVNGVALSSDETTVITVRSEMFGGIDSIVI